MSKNWRKLVYVYLNMPFSFPKAQGPTLLLAVFTLLRLAHSHNLSTSLLPYTHLSKGAVLSCQTQNWILSRTRVSGQKSRHICKGQGIFTIWGCSQLTWETSENAWIWGGHRANCSLVVFILVVLYECLEKWLCLPSPDQTRSSSRCHGETFWVRILPPCACISAP